MPNIRKFINYAKKHPHLVLLCLILIIALFFRAYKLIEWFEFAQDGDLYSWIVKDIVVDKHLRLIGQLTTAPGIFIGPAFYYILIPFFLVARMDPVGAVIPITLIGVLTVASYYYVFSKLFNKEAGLVIAFLYAILLSLVIFDRRVVPSTPTNLWLVWYFYTVLMIRRGNFSVLPLLGVLIGLIWHIHIALAPALIAVPVALVFSGKIPPLKQIFLSVFAFFVTSLPLILFEARHNFSQTTSFIQNLFINQGGGTGFEKMQLVIIKMFGDIIRLFFYPQGLPFINHYLFIALLLLSGLLLVKKQLLHIRELTIFYVWIGTIILFYTFSSTIISEYYFANIEIIFLTIAALLLYLLYKSSRLGKYWTIGILLVVFFKNSFFILTTDIYHKGYVERKGAAAFITEDAQKHGLPCVAISYITSPGENVGFRYFFFLNNLKTTQIQEGAATYSIVLPPHLAQGQNEKLFGQIKIIPPEKIPPTAEITKSCSGQNANLTDPLFGFTK